MRCHRSSHGFRAAQRSVVSWARACVPSAKPQSYAPPPTGSQRWRCTRRPLTDSIACMPCMCSLSCRRASVVSWPSWTSMGCAASTCPTCCRRKQRDHQRCCDEPQHVCDPRALGCADDSARASTSPSPLGDDQSLMTIELSLLPPGRFDEFQDGWSLTCDQLAALLHWLLIHGRGTGEVQRLGCDYARVCRVPNPVSHSQLR